MSQKIRIVVVGCGVMGTRITSALLGKKSFEIVGAIDVNPKLSGRDLGELLEPATKLGIAIDADTAAVLSRAKPDAVVHATTSRLEDVFKQVAPVLEAGVDVVSTCEELSFPWKRHPELSKKIDALAKKHGSTIVGTGINPGYLMDTLPLVLTAPCLKVQSVSVTRMMDSSKRRIPFQKKVGTGMTVAEFRQKIDQGEITGHVGLLESINMIAAGLGWEIENAAEAPPEAVVAERDTETGLGVVPRGKVIGLRSSARATRGGEPAISLEFCANAAVKEEYDEVVVRGEPDIRQRILGGVHGDIGTVSMVINTVPLAVGAAPGLLTMKDLPVPRFVL